VFCPLPTGLTRQQACEGLEGSACFHLVQSSAAGEAQAEEGGGEQSGAEADGKLRQEDTSEPPPTPGTADVDAHTPPRTPHTPSPYSPQVRASPLRAQPRGRCSPPTSPSFLPDTPPTQPATPAASHAHALATDPVYAAAYFAALGALSITASAQPWRSPTPPPTHTQHVLLFVPRPPAGARGERHAGVGAGGYLAAAAHARAQARRADWSLLWLLLKLLVAVWVVNQDGSRRSCAFFTALAVGVFLAQAGALQPLLRALQRKAAAAEAAAAGLGPGQRAAAGLGRRSLPQEAGLLLYGLLASLLPGWAPPGAQHQAAAE